MSGGPRDRSAIQEIVTTFDEAWTDGDPVRYAAQYAGAEWVGPDGTILTDPAAITQLYQFVIGVLFPGTTRESTIRHLTFLTGTVAVLDISTQVTGAGGVVLARALEKNILIKRGGVWSIVQHQQVLVAPVS
ncbi:MAG TPA: nuclear transport factor 2 family protein [Gemmatimonadales bacterium]